VLALDPDVARQMPQPFRGKSTPKHEAEENDNCTENNQKFYDLMHQPIFFDKSRDGKSRMVGRDSVEPKNRIANSTAPRSIPYQPCPGRPPARELRSAMHAKRFE